jgi:putative transcriptional regulator
MPDRVVVETLDTPLFLVAMPQVADPFFYRSVVLLLEHSEEGSFGLVVNRMTELPLSAILEELGLERQSQDDTFAFFGGPVHPSVGTALFRNGTAEADPGQTLDVGDGVRLSQDIRVLRRIAETPTLRFRLVLGSAGWVSGQLESELRRNDWLIAPFDANLLFTTANQEMWERALEMIGVRPESLPAWTGGDVGDAN